MAVRIGAGSNMLVSYRLQKENKLKCERTNCEISEGEKETAKRLNMHPEDVHHIMDTFCDAVGDLTKAKQKLKQ